MLYTKIKARFLAAAFFILVGIFSSITGAVDHAFCNESWNHHSCFFQEIIDEDDEDCFYDHITWTSTSPCDNCSKSADPAGWELPHHGCIKKILEAFEGEYPEYVKLVPIGETVQGRYLYAVRIGTDDFYAANHPKAGLPKPTILLDGSMHANEMPGTRILLDWMDYILNPENAIQGIDLLPGGAPMTFSQLLEERVIWIIPVVNADGYEHETNGRVNVNGVNLARNFTFGWNPTEDATYPLSQPEARAVAQFAEVIRPAMYLTIHGWRTGLSALDTDTTSVPNVKYQGYVDASGSYQAEMTNNYLFNDSGRLIPIANNADNWEVTRQGFPSTDVMWYVCRDCVGDDTLQRLAETDQESRLPTGGATWDSHKHIAPRFYAPFRQNAYAHYTGGALLGRGQNTGSTGQSIGHMNNMYGAVSILYEVQYRDNDSEKLNVHVADVPTPLLCDATATQAFSYIWQNCKDEEAIQVMIRDAFYPLNRIAIAAENPIPKGIDTGGGSSPRNDLSVVKMTAHRDECNLNTTYNYWPIYGKDKSPVDLRRGFFGEESIDCYVKNYGNKASGSFEIVLHAKENGVIVATENCNVSPGLAAEAFAVCSLNNVTIEKNERYDISCAVQYPIAAPAETEVDAIIRNNDPGCTELSARYGTAIEESNALPCVYDAASSNWDAVFPTNNKIRIQYVAEIDPVPYCEMNGVTDTAININGQITGGLPALYGISL